MISLCTPINDNYLFEIELMNQTEDSHNITPSGECQVRRSQTSGMNVLTTFDGLRVEIPQLSNECEVVIAKDCTPSRLFTILGQKKEGSILIRALLPQTEIEVNLLSSWTTGAQIKVNGEVKVIKEGEKTEIVIKSQYDEMLAELTQVGSIVYVHVPKIGLQLSVSDKQLKIKVSISILSE